MSRSGAAVAVAVDGGGWDASSYFEELADVERALLARAQDDLRAAVDALAGLQRKAMKQASEELERWGDLDGAAWIRRQKR